MLGRSGAVDRDRLDILRSRKQPLFTQAFLHRNRCIFDYLDANDCMLEQEPRERLAALSQLMAYRHEGFFFAMDTYREYKYLNELWDNGKAPWKVWE